jgi:type VI secretion system protein ImpJ
MEQGAITIGRGMDNDWVLPDPERIVSNRHCTIQYRDGEYFITDTSTNGVFVNHSEDRIERGESVKLHDHDHLSLGTYELLVHIEPAAGYDTGSVTAAGLVTDIISTPDLNGNRSDDIAASVPPLGESVAMGKDALQASEDEDDAEEDFNTEKPKSKSSKEEEYLGVTEFEWPIDKIDPSVAASSESETPDSAMSESAEENVSKVANLSQEVARQDIEELDKSEDSDDGQAHSAMTSELEELFLVDDDRSALGSALQENIENRDAPEAPLPEQLDLAEKGQTAQRDPEQEQSAQVAEVSEQESMNSKEHRALEERSSPEDPMDLSESVAAPGQFGEVIPENWWREESSQINELSAASIELPIQQPDFLLETRLAEHFRQQQKYFTTLIKGSYRYLQPYHWGIETLQLDNDALARGKIALALARGLMPDGTFFDMPAANGLPEPLSIGREIRQTYVVLRPCDDHSALGEWHHGKSAPLEISDNQSYQGQLPPLRLQLDSGTASDQSGIAIARIREVRPDQQIVLDETYVPPALDCHQIPILNNYIYEIRNLLQHCGNNLALELDAKSDDNGDVVPLLLLQVINRYEVCFAHLANAALVHPVDLYQQMSQMVAEIATFVKHQRRPVRVTAYDHRNLEVTFAPLLTELRQLLSVDRQQAIQIPLKERGYGIYMAVLGNRERRFLESANLVLEIHTQRGTETLTDLLPNSVTIGPVEKIAQLVNQKQSGIGLNPLPEAPKGMTAQANAMYYQIDNNCPAWQQLATSKGLAFHVTEELSELDMGLWVITA